MSRTRGFSLVELMIVLVVVAVLATLALPAYQDQVRKARRSDAIAAMLRIQQAQEQWRGAHAAYAPHLGEGGIAAPAQSSAGRHDLQTGTQAHDAAFAYHVTASSRAADGDPCAHLRLDVQRGELLQRSGPDAGLGNGAEQNRRCWGT